MQDSYEREMHDGHRLRLREKARRVGFEMLPAHEALEIVLYTAIPRGNTNGIAHALLDAFDSLRGVFSASEPELLRVEGVGKRTAEILCAYGRAVRAYEGLTGQKHLRLRTRGDAVAFAEELFNDEICPQTWLALVDQGGSVLYTGRIFAGARWLTDDTRAFIVEHALMYRAHYAVIMAWRGLDLRGIFPTDRRMVQELSEAVSGIGLNIMDYLVVTPWRTISMRRDLAPAPDGLRKDEYGHAVHEVWLSESGDVWEMDAGEEAVFPPAEDAEKTGKNGSDA